MIARYTNRRGYTLVEVLLAMALLITLAFPLLQWMQNQYRFSADDREQIAANLKLQDAAELIRAGFRDDLYSMSVGSTFEEKDPSGRYTLRIRILEQKKHDTSASVKLHQMQLTMLWKDQWGRERSSELVIASAR